MDGDRTPEPDGDLELRIGSEEIVLRRRYEVASIVNDLLIALLFVIGSILFFWTSTADVGTWLFLLGSIQLLVRPVIRLSRRIHIQRIGQGPPESSQDF